METQGYEELIESLTEVIKKDGNEYVYIDGVCVSCNGEETDAGKILRLADLVLEEDVELGISDDQILDAEEEEKKPLKNRTPRFQLFITQLNFDKHSEYKPFFLSGHISVLNRYVKAASSSEDEVVSLPLAYGRYGDGLIPPDDPDSGVFLLFYRSLDEPICWLNQRVLKPLTIPSNNRSIPVYNKFLDIVVNFHAISRDPNDDDDDKVFFQITNEPEDFNLPIQKYDTFCRHKITGHDGYLELLYIVLTDPVDAFLEITFHPDYDICGKLFDVNIFAFYGDDYGLGLKSNPSGFQYFLTLLEADSYALLKKGIITLNRSFLAVPAKGTLKIKVLIQEIEEYIMHVSKLFEFPVKYKGSSHGHKQGKDCSVEVNVNWVYGDATEEGNHDEIQTLNDEEELKTGDNLAVEDQAGSTSDCPRIEGIKKGEKNEKVKSS